MRYNTNKWKCLTLGLALSVCIPASQVALAEDMILGKGTDVKLEFIDPMSSKTARPGDHVRFRVSEDVQENGVTLVREGTRVVGTIEKVTKQKHFGTNAHVYLKMSPVLTVSGRYAPLDFKSKGQDVSSRTGTAAGVSVGSAVILGPIGLAAGYFIVGKSVVAHPGDKMTVEVAEDTTVHVH